MNKPELHINFTRWCHASLKDYFKKNFSGAPLFCEGEEDRDPAHNSFFVEYRIDGPTLGREGTLGEYQGNVEVNVLVTAQREMKYVHRIQDTIGLVINTLDACIPVRRIGSTNTAVDTGAVVGYLQLVTEFPIDVANFGQIDKTLKTQQASVEAHYRIKLEI